MVCNGKFYLRHLMTSGLVLAITIFLLISQGQCASLKRIAIFPLSTEKAESYSYLGPAISEILASRLTGLQEAEVIDETLIKKALGHDHPMPAPVEALKKIARNLHADFFLTGAVISRGREIALDMTLYPLRAGDKAEKFSFSVLSADEILPNLQKVASEIGYQLAHLGNEVTPMSGMPGYAPGEQVFSSAERSSDEPEGLSIARMHPDLFFLEEEQQKSDQKVIEKEVKADKGQKGFSLLAPEEREYPEDNEDIGATPDYPVPVGSVPEHDRKKKTSQGKQSFKGTKEDEEKGWLSWFKLPFRDKKPEEKKTVTVASRSPLPYPTPEEVFGIKKNEVKSSDQEILLKRDVKQAATVPAPEGQRKETRDGRGWLSWLGGNAKVAQEKRHHEAPPSEMPEDGPIWQWY